MHGGAQRGDNGPLYSSHESLPFGPRWRRGRQRRRSWGSPVFPHPGFWFSVLWDEGVLWEGRRVVSAPVLLWATCKGRRRAGRSASPSSSLVCSPSSSLRARLRVVSAPCCGSRKPGPARFPPRLQYYPPPWSVALFCNLVVSAQLEGSYQGNRLFHFL